MKNLLRSTLWVVWCTLPAIVCAAKSRPALIEQIRKLNNTAIASYDGLELEGAKRQLLKAIELARQNGLTSGEELARSYMYLGIVYGAGFNQSEEAVRFFSAALGAYPTVTLDEGRATPQLKEYFANARRETVVVDTGKTFQHTPIARISGGRVTKVRVKLDGSRNAQRVVLYYRSRPGSSDALYKEVEMQSTTSEEKTMVAEIPAMSAPVTSVEYYLEAQDNEGERLDGRGTRGQPLVATVLEADGVGSTKKKRDQGLRFTAFIGTGGGVVVGGETEHALPARNNSVAAVDVQTGTALSPLFAALSADYQINRKFEVGVFGRLQFLNLLSDRPEISNEISGLGLARVKYLFNSMFYGTFGLGGGLIRHRIELGDYDRSPTTPDNIVDSRAAGFFAISFGVGFRYMFNQWIGIGVELNPMVLIPKLAIHADLQLGPVLAIPL